MKSRHDLMDRLKELDDRITAVEQWGAALTAMEEERRSILRALNEPEEN